MKSHRRHDWVSAALLAAFSTFAHGCQGPRGCAGAEGTRDLVQGPPVAQPGGAKAPGRSAPPEVARDQPRIAELLIKPVPEMPGANALWLARIAKGELAPTELTLSLETGPITLRDDGQGGDERAGDSVFSALTRLSTAEIAQHRSRLNEARSSAEEGPVSIFDVRRKVAASPALIERMGVPPLARAEGVIPVQRPLQAPVNVDIERSLMITDLSVIEDPARTWSRCAAAERRMGKWTFGYLMEQMANERATGIHPAAFVERWLEHWNAPQTLHGFTVPARPRIQEILNEWPRVSGSLDLAQAPLRLLAIVNRIDLRRNAGPEDAGELRFVFGVVRGRECSPAPFTVILEYKVAKSGCNELKAWAQQWAELGNLDIGSSAYLAALEAITDPVVRAGAAPNRPNGSALGQIRTNEIALGAPWELREFHLSGSGPGAAHLQETAVAQSPDVSLNATPVLLEYMRENADRILRQEHEVPIEYQGRPFLAGAAPAQSPGFFWTSGRGEVAYLTRMNLSLATCNGCHAGETSTQFTHVSPAAFGQRPALSGFLTGICVQDPNGTAQCSSFSDLERRRDDLGALVGLTCAQEAVRPPLRMVH